MAFENPGDFFLCKASKIRVMIFFLRGNVAGTAGKAQTLTLTRMVLLECKARVISTRFLNLQSWGFKISLFLSQ